MFWPAVAIIRFYQSKTLFKIVLYTLCNSCVFDYLHTYQFIYTVGMTHFKAQQFSLLKHSRLQT